MSRIKGFHITLLISCHLLPLELDGWALLSRNQYDTFPPWKTSSRRTALTSTEQVENTQSLRDSSAGEKGLRARTLRPGILPACLCGWVPAWLGACVAGCWFEANNFSAPLLLHGENRESHCTNSSRFHESVLANVSRVPGTGAPGWANSIANIIKVILLKAFM